MLASLFQAEERAIQSTAWGAWPGDESYTWSGANVSRETSLQLLAVYGSVRLIVDQISTLPLDERSKNPDGSIRSWQLPTWLEYPEVDVHRTSWLGKVLSSLLLDGDAFIALLYANGALVELVPLDSKKVQIDRQNGRKIVKINGERANFPVLHIPGLMLAGTDRGLSPVEAARQSIGAGLAVQEFASRFFGQGAVMAGVIESPNEPTPEQIKLMTRSFAKKHGGKANAHLPGMLVGGAQWKQTGVTNEQAQFLQTRAFTAAEIAGMMFLLDPSDLGIPPQSGTGSSITYANLEQRNARRVQVALLPWIVRLEMALSSLLPAPRYIKFNTAGLLRGDTKTRYESYQIGITNRFLAVPEVRAFEDLPPMEPPA